MTEQIPAADFVLLVCTETYLRRVQHREQQGKGRGVVWEANLIYNLLYREDPKVQRFIPILFNAADSSFIPLPLEGLTHYRVDTEQGYEDLYRHLTNQPRNLNPGTWRTKISPAERAAKLSVFPAAKPDPKPPTNLEQRHRASCSSKSAWIGSRVSSISRCTKWHGWNSA
jgi:hypothetical protein